MLMQEVKEIKQIPDTRLAKRDFANRLYDSCANIAIALMVLAMFFAFLPLTLALGYFFLVFLLIMFSIGLVLFTVGLIFTVEGNILSQLWGLVGDFNIDKAVQVQGVVEPIILSLLGIFLVITMCGVFTKTRIKKGKYIAVFVVGLIMIVLAVIFYAMSRSSK